MVSATQLRVGNVIALNGSLYRVMSVRRVHHKRTAYIATKLKGVDEDANREHRFRSSDRVELAIINTRDLEYLYNTGPEYVFMDVETYEQISLGAEMMGDAPSYLLPNERVKIQYHHGKPIGMEVPLFVTLAIEETEPPLKGATATGSPKSAKLETGLMVSVPQYMRVGDKVKIDTRDNSFVERVD